MQGISKSQVSRLCAELDSEVQRFRSRKLERPYPYVWLDATFVKVREHGRVVSQSGDCLLSERNRSSAALALWFADHRARQCPTITFADDQARVREIHIITRQRSASPMRIR